MSWDVLIIFLMVFLLFIIVVIITDKMDEKMDKQRSHEIDVRMKSRPYLGPHWLIQEEECANMAKAKKLTREQRKMLNEHGVSDTSTWVYLGTEVDDHRGCKSLSRNEPKEVVMVFKDTATGVIKNIVQE